MTLVRQGRRDPPGEAGRGAAPAVPEQLPPDAVVRDRLWQASISVCLVVLAFVQAPGIVSADTKLDLLTNPAGFLSRATSLWDPIAAAGQLQNQAYGYLFPMGPFFAAGIGAGLPAWVVQRLWWTLILLVAYHGTRRLCIAWDVGTPATRVAAALAFTLSPRLLGTLGAVSSEVWPMALTPWVLLPLVRIRPGEERRAAARSGVAVLMLGGINAVASGAALVLPALWLATRRPGRSVRRLQAWWVVCATAACAWWLVPLLLLGRYSPPFLDWIESAAVTTAPGAVTEALRGTTQWIPGLVTGQGPRWPAAHAVLVDRSTVALGVGLAALGLIGLVHWRMHHRRFLLVSLLVGLALVTAGHVGDVASPWAQEVRTLLDGPFSPLRNVHKFEPVVRLPLVLGLAHVLSVGRPRWVAPAALGGFPWHRLLPGLVTASALLALASPAALVGVSQLGAFRQVPSYWPQAARWLAAAPDGARTLVLPGASFASSTWGDPRDEPLQPYAEAPWLVRDAVPLGSGGLTRVLTAVEDRVATGYGGPELGEALARLGVRRVLLRNDLDWRAGGTPSPLLVRQAVLSIPGARPVAHFGPPVGGSATPGVVLDDGVDQPLPAVEVVELSQSPTSLVRTVDAAHVRTVTGGPEAVLAAGGATGPAFVLDSDTASRAALRTLGSPGPTVVTDTLQRREATFSSVRNNRGPVLRPEDSFRQPRAVHDWLTPWVEETNPTPYTVATSPSGWASASSSSAQPSGFAARLLAGAPVSAFDGNGDSAWRSSSATPVGQWVRADLPSETSLPSSVDVVLDVAHGADVSELVVTTAQGTARTPVSSPSVVPGADPARYRVPVTVPAGPTRFFTLTIAGTRPPAGRPVVVRDVGAGVLPKVADTLLAPGAASLDGAGSSVVAAFSATDDRRSACVAGPDQITRCDPSAARPGEQDVAIDRVLRTSGHALAELSGTVAPADSPTLDDLLRVPGALRASASSRLVDDARVRPDAVVDGSPATYWAPAADDPRPTVEVSWGERRQVSGFELRTADAVTGARPMRVAVTVGSSTYDSDVGLDGRVRFPPTTGTSLTVTVLQSTPVRSLRSGLSTPMPVVVGEIVVPGLEGRARSLAPDQATGMPCGFGPRLTVDGHEVATQAMGTVGDLLAGRALRWRSCDAVDLAAGTHRLRAESTAQLVVRSMRVGHQQATVAAMADAPVVRSWGRTSRTVELPASSSGRVLTVEENASGGWTATMGGRRLAAVTVDGWAQGWVVPAGQGGAVQLTFGPQRPFVAGLVAGGVLAVAVLVLAVARPRRRDPEPAAPRRPCGQPLPPAVVVAAGTALLVAVCGPVGLLALPLAVLARGRLRHLLLLASVLALSIGAAAAAVAPWPAAAATNRQGLAELLAAVGLAAVVALTGVSARGRVGR